jgi:hypothetical protein
VSLQGLEDRTSAIRALYKKPVIWDEVEYEGDIPTGWGSLSGQQEVDRFWWGASLGVFVGHSETILRANITVDDEQPLWWAKGGKLIGSSPERVAWLRSLWQPGAEESAHKHGHGHVHHGRAAASLATPLFPPDLGSLVPTQQHFGTNSSEPPAANMLANSRTQCNDETTFMFLHFLRNGSWTIPLHSSAGASASAGSTGYTHTKAGGHTPWSLIQVDYWAMTLRETVIPPNATYITVDVSALPHNIIIKRQT